MLKKIHVTLMFIMLLAVCLTACGTESEGASLEVTCSEFKEQPKVVRNLEVEEGGTFTVTLCTSVTSGFLWSDEVAISDDTVVYLVEHEIQGKGMLDASSKEVWTFQALSAGNSTIKFRYSRLWEIDSAQRLWTLDLATCVK
jgi:predicted secreted protein